MRGIGIGIGLGPDKSIGNSGGIAGSPPAWLLTLAMALPALGLGFPGPTSAQEFKDLSACKPGVAVMNRSNVRGTVLFPGDGMCRVRWQDGSETFAMVWMLRPAGASSTTAERLLPGVYPCYSGSSYLFMDLRILNASTYADRSGKQGRFRLDPVSKRMQFSSGPLQGANGQLMDGPRIGLNMNGGSFYNVTCSLKRS